MTSLGIVGDLLQVPLWPHGRVDDPEGIHWRGYTEDRAGALAIVERNADPKDERCPPQGCPEFQRSCKTWSDPYGCGGCCSCRGCYQAAMLAMEAPFTWEGDDA